MASNIFQLLEAIRRKPGLYLSGPSLRDLANLIQGYQIALYECGVAVDDKFSEDFQPWIQKKFNVTLTRRWDAIIEFHTINNVEAMKRFWELLDEFLDEQNKCGAGSRESIPAVVTRQPAVGRTG